MEEDDEDDDEDPRGEFSLHLEKHDQYCSHMECSRCQHPYRKGDMVVTWHVGLPPSEGTGGWDIGWDDDICLKCFKALVGKRLFAALVKEYDKKKR